MIYIYPEKNLRAYPGAVRGTEEWDSTYKIRVNELKSDIRNIDVNPNVTNDKDKVLLTTKHITDAKQTVNNTYMNRAVPVRPTFKTDSPEFNNLFGDLFGGGNVKTTTTQNSTPRFCGNCGKPLNPGDRFCGNCGSQIK